MGILPAPGHRGGLSQHPSLCQGLDGGKLLPRVHTSRNFTRDRIPSFRATCHSDASLIPSSVPRPLSLLSRLSPRKGRLGLNFPSSSSSPSLPIVASIVSRPSHFSALSSLWLPGFRFSVLSFPDHHNQVLALSSRGTGSKGRKANTGIRFIFVPDC
jgi:hypothetical protein